MGKFWVKGPGSTLSLFLLAPVAGTLRTNSSNATYTVDSTGGGPDYIIGHNRAGATSYVMPVQGNTSRQLVLRDETGAINTLANNVFLVPNGADKFNGSSGFSLTGTVTTNGTTTITGAGTKFQSELAPGMSIIISNQAGVNYIINTIASDTSLTLTAAFTGASASGLTVKRTSLTFAANYGTLYIDGNGTDWTVKGDGTPTVLTYTASSGGTVAPIIFPAGVTTADFEGCGGGGGGGGGQGNAFSVPEGSPVPAGQGGGGGGSGILVRTKETIVGNIAYAVTIGVGGAGGAGSVGGNGTAGAAATPGGPGTPTTVGSLLQFLGASGGLGGGNSFPSAACPGGAGHTVGVPSSNSDTTQNTYAYCDAAAIAGSITAGAPTLVGTVGALIQSGGVSCPTIAPSSTAGCSALTSTASAGGGGGQGTIGTGSATATTGASGGGGGAAGPYGIGGNGGGGAGSAAGTSGGTGGAAGTGGNGGVAGGGAGTSNGGVGGAGGAGVANSGGGGGGGGGGGNSAAAAGRSGGAGGAGASAQLTATYVL